MYIAMKTLIASLITLGLVQGVSAAVVVPDSYAYNTSIDNQSDPGLTLLNDDELGVGSWNGGDYVGFGDEGTNAWASITFTFDAVYEFQTIDLYTYDGFNAGYVEVSTSTDNSTFSSPTQYILTNTAVGGGSSAVTDTLDVSALDSAQYITIEYFKTATYPGTGNWVFPSEVDFNGVTVVIPEPASVALLGVGGLLIAGRRRRA